MAYLDVVGARQHNLKNVSCRLPRNQLVLITGPSGSGKSSLAFDTIYAEGQRRYVESLSAYARQFLDQLPKPDVDSIEGLSPAIAIEQKALGRNPRSTVGTVTEIADYLRLLFARVGTPYCPKSGRPLRAYTVQEIVDTALERSENTKLVLLAPVARRRRGNLSDEIEHLRREGFVRARLDGALVDLGDEPPVDDQKEHDLEVVIDRLVIRSSVKSRLTDSVELALKVGDGTLMLDFMDDESPKVMSEQLVSWEHGITLPPLEPKLFSFNSPYGACPACSGLGMRSMISPERIVGDENRSIREGAVTAFGRRGSVAMATEVDRVVKALGVDPDVSWKDLPEQTRQSILFGTPEKPTSKAASSKSKRAKKASARRKPGYEGVVVRLQRLLEEAEPPSEDALEEGALTEDDLNRFAVAQVCESCGGSRLRPEALSVKLGTRSVADLCALPLDELHDFFSKLDEQAGLSPRQREIAEPLARAILARLGFLMDVGLDYLTLERSTKTLSGGEGQRIRLATQIGAALVGVLYVLDEPSVGLHPKDNSRLLRALRRLVDKGNTVLVVEHDRDAILAADYVVDMGPGAGDQGGQIVACGPPAQLQKERHSVTGPYLSGKKRLRPPSKRLKPGKAQLSILGARAHNLKNIDCHIPLGLITAVTGVSGSGKSSLIVDTLLSASRSALYASKDWVGACDAVRGLEHIDKVLSIDQAPIGRTPRSNPATYSGIFGQLRTLYAGLPEARARGYKAGRFSFNVKGGRCEACQGDGLLRVEMHFLPDVYVECDVCGGRRYNRETLEVKYRGMSIADALDLTVDAASEQFESIPRMAQGLAAMREVGLGYLTLGQPATTLSGGEAQRLKLATELAKTATGKTLYVLDEPTTGLHFSDIELLANALFSLREAGNTIVVIEHNLDLIACSDWVIDLGPLGGKHGGELVTYGTPAAVAACPSSHTGAYLKQYVEQPAARTSSGKQQRNPRRNQETVS